MQSLQCRIASQHKIDVLTVQVEAEAGIEDFCIQVTVQRFSQGFLLNSWICPTVEFAEKAIVMR